MKIQVLLLLTALQGGACIQDLYLLGLFPLEGAWRGGASQVVAVDMALREVNARDDVLPGYRLNLIWNNTKCNPGIGVDVMYKSLISPPTKIMIIGAGCSIVSQATAQASYLWNLVQMSYISVSPALSDKTRFPRFFRANAPDVDVNPAIVDIFKQFGWTNVATIHFSYELFSAPISDLIQRLKAANMTIVRSEIISSTPQIQVDNLKKSDVRIIVGSFYADMAQQVFCHAYKIGLYGPKVVWVVNGWYETEWWKVENPDVDCTVAELATAIEGYWAVDRIYQNPRGERALSGLTPQEFLIQYQNETTPNMPGLRYGPMTYDTTWAMVLSLNDSLTELINSGSPKRLEDFDYTDDELGKLLLENTKKVNFMGVRGNFRFNENGDMVSVYRVDRLQGSKIDMVGLYDPNLLTDVKLEWLVDSAPVVWKGNRIPKDSVSVSTLLVTLPLSIYTCMCVLAGLGMLLSCIFLGFNIHFRKIRVVKMSSPRLNNVIIVGCLLLYSTVFLHDRTSTVVSQVCKAKVLLMLIGFSMAFGALFAKTWRVHYIFTNATKQKKILTDTQLFIMVGGLVVLNSTVVVVWMVVDPVVVLLKHLSPERDEDNDIEIRKYVETCESPKQIYFMATLFGIQGILLLLGTFLAWETRKVTVDGLNDSKMIGVCIYNVVVLSVLGVTVSMAMGDQVSLNYALSSIIVILATTVTQCLIIVPKITAYKQKRNRVGDEAGTVNTRINTATTHLAPPKTVDTRIMAIQSQVHERDKMIQGLNAEIMKLKQKLKETTGVSHMKSKMYIIAEGSAKQSTNCNRDKTVGVGDETKNNTKEEMGNNDTDKDTDKDSAYTEADRCESILENRNDRIENRGDTEEKNTEDTVGNSGNKVGSSGGTMENGESTVENGGNEVENEKVEHQKDTLEKIDDPVENSRDKVENREDKVENRGDTVENRGGTVEESGNKERNSREKVKKHEDRVENHEDKVENHRNKVENHGDKVENHRDKVETHKDKVENHGDTVEETGYKVTNSRDKVENRGDELEIVENMSETTHRNNPTEKSENLKSNIGGENSGRVLAAKEDTKPSVTIMNKAGLLNIPTHVDGIDPNPDL